jgi:hypothetical protein
MPKRNPIMSASTEKVVTYAIGAGITYFLIVKPVLVKLGILKSAAEIAQENVNAENVDTYVANTLKVQSPTKSVGEWTIIANQLYEDLKYSSLSDNKADAGYQVTRVKNDADFATLYKAFGKRQEYYFGVPYGGLRDLIAFIKSNLDSDAITTINNNYASKKIKFRF